MSGEIEASFEAAIKAGKINGAVLCATNASGEFTYNKALGERVLLSGERKAQQLDDVLFLASATKLVATIAALQCVEDGLLSLTGDLSAVAPELMEKQVITGFADDDKTPILEPAGRPITLEMLLTHSAGTAYDFLSPLVGKWRKTVAPLEQGARKPVEELFIYPLAHQPGGGWMYGCGVDWAGRIVERVTSKTLGEHISERIMAPLGSKDAEFFPVEREDLRARLVDLNPGDPEAYGRAMVGGTPGGNLSTKGDFGGHGLFMPGPDFVKILHSLLANDGKLLKPATVDDMFTHHLNPESTAAHQAALASPAGVFFRVGVDPATEIGFGLGGLLTLGDSKDGYGENTLSWGGGMTLVFFIDRKNDLCGVGAVQASLPPNGEAVNEMKDVFRRDIYRKYAAWKAEH